MYQKNVLLLLSETRYTQQLKVISSLFISRNDSPEVEGDIYLTGHVISLITLTDDIVFERSFYNSNQFQFVSHAIQNGSNYIQCLLEYWIHYGLMKR